MASYDRLAIIFLFWSYFSHFKSDFVSVKSKIGLLQSYNLSSCLDIHQLVSHKCPLLPWLALIFLFWSYLSHFQSDLDCVKSKVGFFNLYNQSSYLASHNLVSPKCHDNLLHFWLYIISSWILMVGNEKLVFGLHNLHNLTSPIYQTLYTKLNQIFSLGTNPNLPNQIY